MPLQKAQLLVRARLTITSFREFAFEYQPNRGKAEVLHRNKLSRIRRAS
jgi:hypothetical protein